MGLPLDRRQEVSLVRSVIISVLALLLLVQLAFTYRMIEGRVTVVWDLDTIVISGTPIRLNGVDGPEKSTR